MTMRAKVWILIGEFDTFLLFMWKKNDNISQHFIALFPLEMALAVSFKQSRHICQWTAPHPEMQSTGFDVIIHNKNKRLINFKMDILFL